MSRGIYGIGHSTRSTHEFHQLLLAHGITLLVDIRSYPSSAKYPQYNQDDLRNHLSEVGIGYYHLPNLGGKRKSQLNVEMSKQKGFQNASFRAYAEYMETEDFRGGIIDLIYLANENPGNTTILCSEGNPYKCHRRLVMDYLVTMGTPVYHISSRITAKPHTLTEEAIIQNNIIIYYPNGPRKSITESFLEVDESWGL